MQGQRVTMDVKSLQSSPVRPGIGGSKRGTFKCNASDLQWEVPWPGVLGATPFMLIIGLSLGPKSVISYTFARIHPMAITYEWQVRSYDGKGGKCVGMDVFDGDNPSGAREACRRVAHGGARHVDMMLFYERSTDRDGVVGDGYAKVDLVNGTVPDEFGDGKPVPIKYRRKAGMFRGLTS